MAVSEDEIVGVAGSTPPASTEDDTAEGELPEELMKIPALLTLMEGKPGAAYATVEDANLPEIQAIQRNVKSLEDIGFGVFQAADEGFEVLYNQRFVNPEEVGIAIQSGRLDDIAVPFRELVASTNATAKGAAETSSTVSSPAAAQPSGAPPSSEVTDQLATTRLRNIALGSPTSGPSPGAGRILNAIQKTVV